MSKNRVKNLQTAQGMVEFALVLPILLLVIFAVFAFGHLFFTYSSVVSASREAARWGSASGVSESLRPRYSDCDSIRAAAVRVGTFAGVAAVDSPDANTPGIAITFDHGPNDPNPPFDDCSDGLGAAVVGYGDRINVRVTVDYRPIVPLVNIPSFHLTANTSRTIVKSLPVGDAPEVAASCPTTTIVLEVLPMPVPAILPASPQVNQPVDVRVRVIASDGTSPTGVVDIVDYDPEDPSNVHTCSVSATSSEAGRTCYRASPYRPPLIPEGYETAGPKYITALYDNRGTCYQPSELVDEPFEVLKGNTTTVITSDDPDPSWPYNPDYPETANTASVLVKFNVLPEYPAGAFPSGGRVVVSDLSKEHTCIDPSIFNGSGSCTILLSETTNLVAYYEGDVNFNPSPNSNPELHTIRVLPTATPTEMPTDIPTEVPGPTPTGILPLCHFHHGAVSFNGNSVQAPILNQNGSDAEIQSVHIHWPAGPAQLTDIRFGADLAGMSTCNNGEGSVAGELNCLWQSPDPLSGLNPTQQTVSSGTPIWLNQAAWLANGTTKVFRLSFNAPLPAGNYAVAIRFTNGCVIGETTYFTP